MCGLCVLRSDVRLVAVHGVTANTLSGVVQGTIMGSHVGDNAWGCALVGDVGGRGCGCRVWVTDRGESHLCFAPPRLGIGGGLLDGPCVAW